MGDGIGVGVGGGGVGVGDGLGVRVDVGLGVLVEVEVGSDVRLRGGVVRGTGVDVKKALARAVGVAAAPSSWRSSPGEMMVKRRTMMAKIKAAPIRY
ncbi:MAG: hypothetical protein HYU86_11240 [Chloroflexi bacterium]|nr:hypothetical protein [Chloroflexota bacterium]